MRQLASIAVTWTALSLAGCHVFESVEDCASDADCPLGDRCHPEGLYCEADPGPIRVGTLLSLTGDFGSLGHPLRDALLVAERVINDTGGVRGREIRFVVVDDATDPALAVQEARRLVEEERVAAVLGPLFSAGAVAVAELTFPERVLTLSPTAGSPLLSTAQPADDRYFFRTIATMRTGSGAAVSMYARERAAPGPRCETMAVVYSDDATGIAYDSAVSELFGKLGGCVLDRIMVPTVQQVDYAEAVARVIAARPDCAHLAVFASAGAKIVRELNAAIALDPTYDWSSFLWLGNTTIHNDTFLEDARVDPTSPVPTEAEGVEGADIDSTPPSKEYADFRLLYNQTLELGDLETDAPAFAANTYDAAVLIALALEHAGGVGDRVKVRDGFLAVTGEGPEHRAFGPTEYADAKASIGRGQPIHYVGASGKLRFDPTGTVSSPTVIWRVEQGAFTEIGGYTDEDIEALLVAEPEPGRCPPPGR